MMTTTTATTRIPFDDVERNFVQHKLIDPHVIGSSLTGETARYMIYVQRCEEVPASH